MRVLRHRRVLASVALLAFAMQAVLALAQTHTHTYSHAGDLAKRAITYGACPASAERPCPPLAPHDDHGKCPLCWSISLASGAVLSMPPPVVLIHLPIGAPPPVRAAEAMPSISTAHFQARAPPHA